MVVLPYLFLTLIVVVTRLVSSSLSERLSNQLLEAGHVVSDAMARQEIKHLGAVKIEVYDQTTAAWNTIYRWGEAITQILITSLSSTKCDVDAIQTLR